MRREKDSMGFVDLPEDCLWGPQTERSRQNFRIGTELMPLELIRALIEIKRAGAQVHQDLEKDADERAKFRAIEEAADALLAMDREELRLHFPLSVWQTGSGTQSNMNANEVLAHMAGQRLGRNVHPNDDVNRAQSSNDVFPTALHLALRQEARRLIHELDLLVECSKEQAARHYYQYKIGRTHCQDAVPMTLGQEISGWAWMLEFHLEDIQKTDFELGVVPLGGTALGTGLNTPEAWQSRILERISRNTGVSLYPPENLFAEMASRGRVAAFHASLDLLAQSLVKIANDLRLLASGPRCGLAEIQLPANEPGSSIMPGKVNPTQCEALIMVCYTVMGHNHSLGLANASGQFQINTTMPMMAYLCLQSMQLLREAMESFRTKCLEGISVNEAQLKRNVEQSLMLVTKLATRLGYDQAADLAKEAGSRGLSIRELVLERGLMTDEEYDELLSLEHMVFIEQSADDWDEFYGADDEQGDCGCGHGHGDCGCGCNHAHD